MGQIAENVQALMQIPGLSGHEKRVADYIRNSLDGLKLCHRTDRLGNVVASIKGDPELPSVMLFTHMDQLGFVVRKIEPDGLLRVERLGGVPERALAAQAVLICTDEGNDIPAVITNKAHHATGPEEKYHVLKVPEIFIDAGCRSKDEAIKAGIKIGAPIVYMPRFMKLAGKRIAGTAIDDRAGCAVLLEVAKTLSKKQKGPEVHLVWSVQEEFNLRGALVAAQTLKPDIAFQIDLMLASDTPDMADRGDMYLGGGPGISLYSFHGRGTLNGVIPHPELVKLTEQVAKTEKIPLQYSAQTGVLTDLSYVQLVGEGVASLDIGFPMRYSHSALESCDLIDLEQLHTLLIAILPAIDKNFDLTGGR
jgi:putative aminopeptidase FrvX